MVKFTLTFVVILFSFSSVSSQKSTPGIINSKALIAYDKALLLPTPIPADFYVGIYNIRQTTATVECQLETEEGTKLLEMGICWSTTDDADTSDNRIKFSRIYKAKESVVNNISGLKPNTRYYVRGYTVDSAGVDYGYPFEFTTEIEVDLTKGLIAYYPFNGNANDESGNLHHGTANGGTPVADRFGKPNAAMAFSGKKNTLAFKGYVLKDPVTTITCWIKPTENSTDILFINTVPKTLTLILRVKNYHYQLELIVGGKKIGLYDVNGYSNFDPARARFDFLALEYDGRAVQLYYNNGILVQQEFDQQLIPYTFPKTVKQDPVISFTGIVDDLRIYSRWLENIEITALHEDRPPSVPVITADSVFLAGPTTISVHSTINYDQTNHIAETGVCWSTSPDPDTTDNTVEGCCGLADIISRISGLNPSTTYYVKAYAINMNGIGYSNELTFKTLKSPEYGSVTDIEGNVYKTVKIGTQTWMAENLKTTKYADGTPLEYRTSAEHNSEGKFYFVNEIMPEYKKTYGLLYTWEAAVNGKLGDTYPEGTQGVCPSGWHIPNRAERDVLINYLGGRDVAGGKLKEAGIKHWYNPNTGATNESGFSARGAGLKYVFQQGSNWEDKYESDRTYFWTSESVLNVDLYSGYILGLSYKSNAVSPETGWTVYGASVRCIKDAENSPKFTREDVDTSKVQQQDTLSHHNPVEVYPNPATTYLYIKDIDNTQISVSDLQGKILITTTVKGNRIDISSLPNGVFLLRVKDKTIRFVKHSAGNTN